MYDPWTITLTVAISFAALAFIMTLVNLPTYRKEHRATGGSGAPSPAGRELGKRFSPASSASSSSAASPASTPTVFVCIPARNEQANIEDCVRRVLASAHANLRVLVYDDQSTDDTPKILARIIAEDDRVRTIPTVPLPEGWVGKMHACHQLGTAAVEIAREHGESANAYILFIDADVRLEPDAISRALNAARAANAELISTFPRQLLGTFAEKLVVPMIHFILFSYLPMRLMRSRNDPGCCAGCGQFLLVRADAYQRIKGHDSFKDSMHDGIKMPRRIRATGGRTDLFDGTRSLTCRMYDSWSATWRGFTKNAYEGLGSPVLLAFFTVMHAVGHILPWGYLIAAPVLGVAEPLPLALAGAAVLMSITQRVLLSAAFRHPLWIALVHPIAVALMTIIQWHSFILSLTNRRSWRGRTFTPATPQSANPS